MDLDAMAGMTSEAGLRNNHRIGLSKSNFSL